MNISDALSYANKIFNSKKNDSPFLDAGILLSYALRKSQEYLLAHPNAKLSKNQWTSFKKLVARRSRHEPIAYIIGKKWFYGLEFFVNRDVLVPRPETETMVEEILKEVKKNSYESGKIAILDVGTGSGCLAISIAKELKKTNPRNKVRIIASDISRTALRVAKTNARAHKILNKIIFSRGNLLYPISRYLDASADTLIIAANLPYLTKNEWRKTKPEIKNYEPKGTLIGGKDGLKSYKKLLQQLNDFYRPGRSNKPCGCVVCFFEINPWQKTSLKKIISSYFPSAQINFIKDLGGAIRLVKFYL